MTPWATTTFILCLYGFLKELRPSEPFLTEYLIDTKWVNITLEEVIKPELNWRFKGWFQLMSK